MKKKMLNVVKRITCNDKKSNNRFLGNKIVCFMLLTVTFALNVSIVSKADSKSETGVVTDVEERSTTWEYNEDTKELILSGDGPMAYCNEAEGWRQYYKVAKKIIIEDGITTVSTDAFNNFYKCAEEVVMADTITKIEAQGFYGCSALNTIKWSESLEIIEANAFSNACQDICNGYKDMAVVFPSGLKTIEDFAFNYCSAIKVYKLPSSLINLQGSSVFQMSADDMTICCSTDDQISYCKKYELKYIDENQHIELNKSNIKIKDTDYTGKEVHPSVWYNKVLLVEGIDYDANYENNVNIGNATMEIDGKGRYSGSINIDFKVTKINIDTTYPLTVYVIVDGKIYDGISYEGGRRGLDFEGKEHECSIDSIYYKGVKLIEDVDYTQKLEMIDPIAGSFQLDIKGINAYSGIVSQNYKFFKMPQLEQCDVEMISGKSVMFNFEEQKPKFRVIYEDFTFPEDRYDVFWSGLLNPDASIYNFCNPNNGTIGLRVFGLEGIEEFEYEIKAIDLSNAEVSFGNEEFVYMGDAITPMPKVKLDGKELNYEADFILSYDNNQSGGTATIIIEGIGGYTGTINKEFNIKTSIKICSIKLSEENVIYSGSECKPDVTIQLENNLLERGKDYNITYKNNIDEGKAEIEIEGIGNYADSAMVVFNISKTDIVDVNCLLSKSSYIYDGTEKCPIVTVKSEDKTLIEDEDYKVTYTHNVDEGTAVATVTGIGVYKGTVQLPYTITKQDISAAKISLDQTSFTYDGMEKKPKVKIEYEGKTLVENTDYNISYSNSNGVGQAGVTVAGKGIYKGTLKAEYTINPISIDSASVSLKDTIFTYDGSAKKPSAAVNLNGALLTEGKDYTLSYRDNINEGTAYAVVQGIGIYSGTIEVSFKILPYNSGMDAVYKEEDTLIDDNYLYHVIDVDNKEVEFSAPADMKESEVVIPSTITLDNGDTFTVTSIGEKAFYKNTKIKKLTVANTVTSIENYAFYGCKNLTSVKIGNGIEIIGDSAFRKCTKLTSITLPKSVDKLGKNVFYGCKKLKTITIKSNQVVDIQSNAIKGVSKKCVIKVPKKLVNKYKKEFNKKTGFTKTMKIKKQ